MTARRLGAPDWIASELLAELDGRLWHATTEDAYRSIVADGAIRPDAPINYKNAFCRSINAVSLFDLAQPDSAASPAATHWSAWLGRSDEDVRIWLEIDRASAGAVVLSAADTLERWRVARADGSKALRIISGLEVAHLGPIPLAHVVRALRIVKGEWLG